MPIPAFLASTPVNWANIPHAGDIQDAFVAYLENHGIDFLAGRGEIPITIWLNRNEAWCVRSELKKSIVTPGLPAHMIQHGFSAHKVRQVQDYLANGGGPFIIAAITTIETGCCPEAESIA